MTTFLYFFVCYKEHFVWNDIIINKEIIYWILRQKEPDFFSFAINAFYHFLFMSLMVIWFTIIIYALVKKLFLQTDKCDIGFVLVVLF